MILADIDLGQIVIVVIAMGAGFVHWLWNALKQGQAEGPKQPSQKTPAQEAEQRRLREEAWKRQTQSQRPRPSPAASPAFDPWGKVRDVFEKLEEQANKAQRPPPLPTPPPVFRPAPPPPPAPQPPRVLRNSVRAELQPPPPLPPADPFPTATAASSRGNERVPASFAPAVPPVDVAGLRGFLQTPAALRQAILMREILGPPKALQSSGDGSF